jgi:hypothetical protein
MMKGGCVPGGSCLSADCEIAVISGSAVSTFVPW